MKRLPWFIIPLALLWGTPAAAETAGVHRNPRPEGVGFTVGIGAFIPTGRFGDAVNSGPAFQLLASYRATEWVGPVLSVQFAPLQPDDSVAGGRGSLDVYDVLGGLRVYVLPEASPLRPYATLLGGWAHYASYRQIPFTPVIGTGHTTRDDPVISPGGGLEVRLHPNVSVGFDVRGRFSFARNEGRGERTLAAMQLSGMLAFHY